MSITEAFLQDGQCILVSGKSKMYLRITFKQPLGKLACAVWGSCRALSNEQHVGGMPAACEEDLGRA